MKLLLMSLLRDRTREKLEYYFNNVHYTVLQFEHMRCQNSYSPAVHSETDIVIFL